MLHDADLHLALFAQVDRLLDGELVAQMDMIVRDWEGGLHGRCGRARRFRRDQMTWCGERGSCQRRGLKESPARIGRGHGVSLTGIGGVDVDPEGRYVP